MNQYNKYDRGCLIALAVFFVTTAFLVYHCASRGLDAEATYEAVEEVMNVATRYLENNPEWPKSWDDLERTAVPSASNPNAMAWPDEFADWKKRVYIDFGLTRAEVAAMNVENFTAIRAIGLSFGPPESEIGQLLKAARQKREAPEAKK